MTWIKICGMTNLEDALVAVDAGADAVGFVFYEKSPRYVSVETAREIVEKLPASVEKVGVFVGVSTPVANFSERAGLTVAQIYTHAQPALTDEYLRSLSCKVIPAISLGSIARDELCGFHVSKEFRSQLIATLLDSGNSQQPGGTGKQFDWRAMSNLTSLAGMNFVVAGGLNPESVTGAIDILHPWGVDVVSGVEAAPGKKDPEKVRAFVRAVREMDRKAS
jgi:phosphoribosylanthranilate isomerase